jgi:uncharacterized protein YbjT (DUF2867 family)
MILVTGATGTNGMELMKLLSACGVPARAMVRSKDSAGGVAALKGVEIAVGDFDRPDSLSRALDGIEKTFLLTNSSERAEEQQCRFVAAARQASVKLIVKLSQYAAEENSPVRFLRYHARVERAIKEAGVAYTFLRPNLYMQGLLSFRASIQTTGTFFAAIGDAKVSVVDVRDNAAAAFAALTEPGHEGRTYHLTGPQALSHAEMAEGLSAAAGRIIRFVDVPPEAMREAVLRIGLPRWQADGLIEDYAHYQRGEAEAVTSGVLDATGHPPLSFPLFAREYADAFA